MSSPGAEPDGAVSDDELLALQLEQRQLDIDREFQQKQLDLDRKMNELRRRRATKSQTPTDLLTPDRNESSQVKAEPTNNHAQISDMPEQATQSSLQSPTSTSETLKPRTATVGVNRYERSPSVGGSGPRFYAERGGTVNHHSCECILKYWHMSFQLTLNKRQRRVLHQACKQQTPQRSG